MPDEAPIAPAGEELVKSAPKVEVGRARAACAACRSVRARCSVPADKAECARCLRLGRECVWVEPQKRGPKPKKARTAPPPPPAPSAALPAPPALDALATVSLQHLPPFSASPATHTSTSALFPPRNPTTRLHKETPGAAEGSLAAVAKEQETALSRLRSSASPPPLPAMAAQRDQSAAYGDDVISRGLLTDHEALELFAIFFAEMNRYIILFDPLLHTLPYVRRTSTALLTALLCAASKYVRPDLYPALLAEAEELILRSTLKGEASVPLLQSILLLVYWKPPLDRSAWMRIGMAIRMGYQLKLHKKRTAPLPAVEHAARLILDSERTWIVLICFDNDYSLSAGDDNDTTHQTRMIPHHRVDILAWIEETKPYQISHAMEHAPAMEWFVVHRLCKEVATSQPLAAHTLTAHLEGMLRTVQQRHLEVESPHSLHYDRLAVLKITFYEHAMSVMLYCALLAAAGIGGSALARFMGAAEKLVAAFEQVAEAGMIKWWQDTIAITMFSLGGFLVKILPQVDTQTQSTLTLWTEQVCRAAERAASLEGDRTDSTAAFIARFFRAAHRVLLSSTSSAAVGAHTNPTAENVAPGLAHTLSLLHPPVIPPAPVQAQVAPPPALPSALPTAPLDLSEPLPQAQAHDDALLEWWDPFAEPTSQDRLFWESLFPDQANNWSFLDLPLNVPLNLDVDPAAALDPGLALDGETGGGAG
ncbi:hypothetical protein JCM10207_000792 [Rhodosporidiobolus poonsookiae]